MGPGGKQRVNDVLLNNFSFLHKYHIFFNFHLVTHLVNLPRDLQSHEKKKRKHLWTHSNKNNFFLFGTCQKGI